MLHNERRIEETRQPTTMVQTTTRVNWLGSWALLFCSKFVDFFMIVVLFEMIVRMRPVDNGLLSLEVT